VRPIPLRPSPKATRIHFSSSEIFIIRFYKIGPTSL
jgi:hypothetical protein